MEKENVEEIEEGKQKEKEDKWVKWAVGFWFYNRSSSLKFLMRNVLQHISL